MNTIGQGWSPFTGVKGEAVINPQETPSTVTGVTGIKVEDLIKGLVVVTVAAPATSVALPTVAQMKASIFLKNMKDGWFTDVHFVNTNATNTFLFGTSTGWTIVGINTGFAAGIKVRIVKNSDLAYTAYMLA